MHTKQVLTIVCFFATSLLAGMVYAQPIIQPVEQVSPDNLPDAEEVSVVIDPLDISHIAASSNPGYFFYSTDRGQSWFGDGLGSSFGEAGDPSLTTDSKGNIYYAHLAYPASTYWLDRVVIQESTDAGKSYSDGTFTGHIPPRQQDKETIVCDKSESSPYFDNLYISWTEFDSYKSPFPLLDSSRILFSRSTDKGQSWSIPIVVSDKQGDCADSSYTVEGATCATAPNGDIYITWSGPNGLIFDKSTDGGISFGKDKVISPLIPGWDFPVAGLSRCNGLATTLCDIGNSKNRGNLYVFFSDKRNGDKNTDVFLLRSQDGGNTWDLPLRVNNDTTQFEQFLPAATIDPVTGVIYCAFYDRRNTNGSLLTDMYLARSIDGGSSFTNYRLTQNSFASNAGVFFGDYIGIAAQNANVYPIWMQVTKQTKALYLARVIDTGAFQDAVLQPANPKDQRLSLQISPNPASQRLNFALICNPEMYCSLILTDMMGREVATIYEGRPDNSMLNLSYNARLLTSGIYYCLARNGSEHVMQKFIISH